MRIIIIVLSLLVISFFAIKQSYFNSENGIGINSKSDENEVPDEEWMERQRAFPFSEVPEAEHLKALEYVKTMPASTFDNSLVFSLAGPTNIEGRITSIAIHPTNSAIVFIG